MTITDYIKAAGRTVSPDFYIKTRQQVDGLHAAVGISTEMHELKKAIRNRNNTNIGEEIADAYWYMTMLIRNGYCNTQAMEYPMQLSGSIEQLFEEATDSADYLLDVIVKKCGFYGRELNKGEVQLRVHRLFSYLDSILVQLGMTSAEVMSKNIAKLKVRYPEKFSLDAAENRNLAAEEMALKSDERKS